MAKKTLLEMVQNILSSMDSDEVNSISDTVESMQVAHIVRETYEGLVATLSIPERRGLVRLDSVSDPNHPNYLYLPDSIKSIKWIRYNGVKIEPLNPDEFMEIVLKYENMNNTVTVEDFIKVSYPILTNRDPQWYTSFDDKHLAFDSFNIGVETTLQGVNSMAWANLNNEFKLEDNFICDLDDNWFPTLLADAKNTAFTDLKQVSNADAQDKARKGLVRIQNELNRMTITDPINRLPDYGRRR